MTLLRLRNEKAQMIHGTYERGFFVHCNSDRG